MASERAAPAFPDPASVPCSVLVPTRNEADEIAACLATVGWARQVAVVDSESTDRTRELAERAGAVVWVRRFDGYGRQKNWAVERLDQPWVLCLDADERVTPALAAEIAAVAAETAREDEPAGYRMPRVSHFLDRRITRAGWGDERVLRLFRRGRARFDHRRVHERLLLEGRAGELTGALLHYPYRSWDECTAKLRPYARAAALELFERGRRAGTADLLWRPLGRFARMYLVQGGFREGAHGVALCGLAAAQSFLRYAYLWELGRAPSPPAWARAVLDRDEAGA